MEIRRFGPGHRRADGSPGSANASGAPIYVDTRLRISEIVLGDRGTYGPHRSLDDAVLVQFVAGDLLDDLAPREDEDAVAEPGELEGVARLHEDRRVFQECRASPRVYQAGEL